MWEMRKQKQQRGHNAGSWEMYLRVYTFYYVVHADRSFDFTLHSITPRKCHHQNWKACNLTKEAELSENVTADLF